MTVVRNGRCSRGGGEKGTNGVYFGVLGYSCDILVVEVFEYRLLVVWVSGCWR